MVSWQRLAPPRLTRQEARSLFGTVFFYADHSLDESGVHVLKYRKYDIVTAHDIGPDRQPDE